MRTELSFSFSHMACLTARRADAFHFQPRFDDIKDAILRTHAAVTLGTVASRSQQTLNPTERPHSKFTYVAIDDVDIATGEIANSSRLYGANAPSRARKLMINDGLLISTVRPKRRAIALIPERLVSAICSTGFSVLVPDPAQIDKYFLWAFLRSYFGASQLEQLGRGASYYAILEHEIDNLQVPLLEKKAQLDIADKMKRVARLEELAERNRQQVNAIISKYFQPRTTSVTEISSSYKVSHAIAEGRTDPRFFDPRHHELEREFSQIKGQKAKASEIGSLGEPLRRGEQPEYNMHGTISVLKTANVQNRKIDWQRCLRVTEQFFKDHPRGQLEREDIVITSTGEGSWGRAAIVDVRRAFADGHLTILNVNNESADPYSVLAFLWSEYGQMQFQQRVRGSTGQTEIYPQDISRIKVLIPSKADQRGIRKTILSYFRTLDKADKLRQQAIQEIEETLEEEKWHH